MGGRKAGEEQVTVRLSGIWLRKVEKSLDESGMVLEMATWGCEQTTGNKKSQ